MKVIIAGGRDFVYYRQLVDRCNHALQHIEEVEIVSGTANGADRLGEQYAREKGYPLKQFPADWEQFGKSAGYKRNVEMAEYADALIAFWNGLSRGTKHMIDIARERGLKVRVYHYF